MHFGFTTPLKSNQIRIITILVTVVIFGVLPTITHAAGVQYETMVNIPGVTDTGSLTLGSYINTLYNLAIVAAALLAVIQLILAGAMYMTSDANVSSKGAARDKMVGAIVGLLIVIAAWVILYEINDRLIQVDPFGAVVPTNVTGVNVTNTRTTAVPDPATPARIGETISTCSSSAERVLNFGRTCSDVHTAGGTVRTQIDPSDPSCIQYTCALRTTGDIEDDIADRLIQDAIDADDFSSVVTEYDLDAIDLSERSDYIHNVWPEECEVDAATGDDTGNEFTTLEDTTAGVIRYLCVTP